MADKITQQITEALTRVAAEPGGMPLYSSKSDVGLFPNSAGSKPAVQKCLTDELIRVTGTDPKGKSPRDLYTLTEKGWEFLLAAVNPKQVLEDFVRVLEARQGEVGELLDTARHMAASLQGLKEAVARVLPTVSEQRIPPTPPAEDPNPQPPPKGEGEKDQDPTRLGSAPPVGESGRFSNSGSPLRVARGAGGGSSTVSPSLQSGGRGVGVQLDLASAILAHLADHTGPTDCTLPELYRAVVLLNPAPSIGEFHDCLRTLHADGALSLHSWTGPLYALPEPQYALLVGHGIAYYVSLRS